MDCAYTIKMFGKHLILLYDTDKGEKRVEYVDVPLKIPECMTFVNHYFAIIRFLLKNKPQKI